MTNNKIIIQKVAQLQIRLNSDYPWSNDYKDSFDTNLANEGIAQSRDSIINEINSHFPHSLQELLRQWGNRENLLMYYDDVDADLDLELFESIELRLSILNFFGIKLSIEDQERLKLLRAQFHKLEEYYGLLASTKTLDKERRLSSRLNWLKSHLSRDL